MLPIATTLPFVLAIFTILVAKLAFGALRNGKQQPPYPPGPKPKFLIGNALDIPGAELSRTFAQWGKKFNSALMCFELEEMLEF